MDIDLDIARTIVEEGIPYGLEYYLGIKLHDHEEGEDDEEEEDEESEEENYGKKKGKKPHKH